VAKVAVAVAAGTDVTLLGEALGADAAGAHALRQTSKTTTRALIQELDLELEPLARHEHLEVW
jgi:hypothetical protein